ncbi:MAG: anaerobic glycerol-3-phosphate dehydrogenase subunit C [Sedimentisphaerales bacterium]|nr:anaerobic glycerol-3-phosphate dehydrogenase subunit C [Sedimentisphaerales bacterium]
MEREKQRDDLQRDLAPLLAGAVRTDRLTRVLYSTDASIYQIEPLAVVLPAEPADVRLTVCYAGEHQIPVICRGGGSGLAGESLGRGIILDFSRYLNRVLSMDPSDDRVTVQAGVVLEQLNRQLAPYGRQIGPDPASGNRATLGGMIANNSTGAHSIRYGYIDRHLADLQMVSAQGRELTLSVHDPAGSDHDPAAHWAGQIDGLLAENQGHLERARPRTDRNRSGYNVFSLREANGINLCRLLAGSEGTLGIVTAATIKLVDLPKVKVLLQVNFDSLGKMARAVPELLKAGPSACELMDGTLLGMARDAYPEYKDVLPGGVAASLLVEFYAETTGQAERKLDEAQRLAELLPPAARCIGTRQITDPGTQALIWKARKAGVPLLFRNKTATQPIPVVEDVGVNPDQLAEYLDGLQDISHRLGVPMAYYAHAGHGALHPRPYLDLHQQEDRQKMRRLADEVFRLAWRLGGTISSEHGEGLVRVSFIEKQYGPQVYRLFRRIKDLFDPEGLLNPGKIINGDPDVMTKDLRFSHASRRPDRPTNLVFRADELVREIEQCNGNGLCRTSDPTLSMCPIFRATGEEEASPRAKGNLMRHWLCGLLDDRIMQSPEFKRIADLCVNCKMCAMECPSLVNVPKLMIEARAEYVRHHGLTRAQYVLTRSEFLSKMGSVFGPAANLFLRMGWFRRLLEWTGRLDHRRGLPAFAWGSNLKKLRRYLGERPPLADAAGKVAYFVDLYANYNDHALGRAVVDVLRHNNIEVIVPPQKGMAMPAISYGDLDYARKYIEYNVKHLAEAARAGYTIVTAEPTAALCLKEEYLDVIDSEDARLVAENTVELTDYLARLHRQGKLRDDFRPPEGLAKNSPRKLAYHQPCHYQYMQIKDGTRYLMGLIDGIELTELPGGCCGIAGTFGFQKGKFDLSMRAGEPLLGPLRDSDCDFGLTECSTCKMQMELGAGKPTLHPIKVLAKAYGLL